MEEKKETREIDVIALMERVFREWRQLLVFVGVAAVVGVVVALSTPKEFKAEVMLAPELSSGGLGLSDNLADMAANFGFDIGVKSNMDAIYPELYPDIFASTDFILRLFDVPVRLQKDTTQRTYFTHVTKELKVPFWDYPKLWLHELLKPKEQIGTGKKDKYVLSRKESDICKGIRDAILCTIDKKTSVITISVVDQDPLVAAILADTLQSRLQDYITAYRTRKARNDYEYYEQMMNEAEKEYKAALYAYAHSVDANMNVKQETYKSRLEEMENDLQVKLNVYTQMSAQFQQSKAKVQERTPAFTIIQEPIMPYKAFGTPRVLVVLFFMFLGVLADAFWILYGRDWYSFRSKK